MWTEAQETLLQLNCGHLSADDLALVLGKSRQDVEQKCEQMGLACRGANGAALGGDAARRPGRGGGRPGKREDLGGQFFRSSWEANYARWLNFLVRAGEVERWEYEPDEFWFPVERGTRSYIPDFKVVYPDGTWEYVEIKGWMDARSKTRLRRMERYYPEIPLRVVGAAEYRALARDAGRLVAGWE